MSAAWVHGTMVTALKNNGLPSASTLSQVVNQSHPMSPSFNPVEQEEDIMRESESVSRKEEPPGLANNIVSFLLRDTWRKRWEGRHCCSTLTLEYASRHTNKQLKFKWSNSWALVCVRGTDQAVKALSTHIDIQTFTWYLTIKLYMIIGIALGIWINLKVLCISCTFVLQTLNCASSDEKCTIGHFWIIWFKMFALQWIQRAKNPKETLNLN